MGVMKLLMLLLLVLFSFTFPLSFSQLANKYSEKPPLHESHGSVSSVSNGTVNQIKFARASARGGGGHGGGRSAGEGSNGNGGQSNSSPQRGGGAVIPVYAGSGAAANRNNHHTNASICSRYHKDELLTVVATALTSLLLYLTM